MDEKQWVPGAGDRFISCSFNVVEMPLPSPENDHGRRMHLLSWGETELEDAALRELFGEPGTVLVDNVSAQMVKLNFDASPIDLHVNLDHRQLGDGQAVGWITGIYADEESGLGVHVDWTKEGQDLIESKAYRYTSGEFSVDRQSGRIVAISGAALTNRPAAVHGMRPVELSLLTAVPKQQQTARTGRKGESKMDFNAYFARLTGRKIDDEGEAVVAASELHAQAQLAEKLTIELAASREEVATLAASLAELTTRANAAEAAVAKQAIEAKVTTEITAGRLHLSQKEWALTKTVEELDICLSGIKPGTFTPPKGQIVSDDAINKPSTIGLSELAVRQAKADEIAVFAKENNISFAQASVLLGKKGAK